MNWKIIPMACLFISAANLVNAQENNDTIQLEKVVMTGQFSQQSLDKSIHQVEVISQEDIKNRAANTIADILNYNININITPNSETGNSEVSMFGLGGGYVKVLIDNIPMVGDNGFGNSIDLTKINLDNVERIEIVRGGMGVEYGSNAFAGVINIITKKGNRQKAWHVNGYAQEETVGKEYDWRERGRHIQALNLSHNFNDKWYFSAGVNRNDFQGLLGDRKGKRSIENGERGYEWLPKEQWNANAFIQYKNKDFLIFYKAQYLNELINYYNSVVNYNKLEADGLYKYYSNDRDYLTERWIHQVFTSFKLFDQVLFSGDFSYQIQNRKYRDFIYDIGERDVFGSKPDYDSYAKTEVYYSRGTFSKFVNSNIFDFQLGYEVTATNGFRKAESTTVEGMNVPGFKEDLDEDLNNYDVFALAEWRPNNGLSFRPGVRVSFNSKFETIPSFSLATKYKLTDLADIRAEFATANRTPNFDELFTYFVDANHNIQGNENLNPEKGYSTAIHLNQKIVGHSIKANLSFSTTFIELKDKIELATVQFNPLSYKYINIDKYRTWGLSSMNDLTVNNWNFGVSASIFGVSKIIEQTASDGEIPVMDDKYLYNFQLNGQVNYTIKKWQTTLSAYYKYTGKDYQFYLDSESNTYKRGKQQDYQMLDASIRKGFYKNKFELTIGARNLLDVKNVNITSQQTGAHSGNVSSVNLFYGRSYFAKLAFNLAFNQNN